MTSYELAHLLLSKPDLPVAVDSCEENNIEISEWTDQYGRKILCLDAGCELEDCEFEWHIKEEE